MAHTDVDQPDSRHHEESDVNIRAIFGFGAGLAVSLIAVSLLVGVLFVYMDRREAATSAPAYPLAGGQEIRLPPEPRLQKTPREDLRAFKAREDDVLRGYQWVDQQTGVVRIPIDEAMKLTLQRGLPARPAQEEKK
jgi:hypothetical protein